MSKTESALHDISSLPDLALEKKLFVAGHVRVAGTDEAGRGCLAGPVVAAAVILDIDVELDAVRDSKVVPAEERELLAAIVKERAVAWSVASCSPQEIDTLNILWASMEAMSRAVSGLHAEPSYVLADGNHIAPDQQLPWEPIVKGDALSLSIAAASIIAKVERDRIMQDLSVDFPEYGWESNFGYPTQHHYDALSKFGATPWHRRSFRLFDMQFDLFEVKTMPPPVQ